MVLEARRQKAHERLARALNVASPFPWQLALLDRFLESRATSAIDVPTGLGKTAVMAIWLVARAAGAAVPRRLIYVVDRRAVVDQATQVAKDLRELVSADIELQQALGLEGALPISTLRGKHLDNREWLVDPSAPAIVLGTVDMIGSRLLFQGYGVSRKMRPYHAGLLGTDSLVVLDEAHLVPPFERLIEAIASGRDANGRSLRAEEGPQGFIPPLLFLSLSATGRGREDSLQLSDADRAHPIVARRLAAVKQITFADEVPARELAERLADEAWSLAAGGQQPIRCIVFCNSRDDATKVKEALGERSKKTGIDRIDVELFVGGRRLYERDQAARWLESRGFLAGSAGRPEVATFVIATSAGEVGVDLDADELACDLVAWERMVQRLGRVNRRGDGDARVRVVPVVPEDEIMKLRLDAVRLLINELPLTSTDARDASPGAITGLKLRASQDTTLADLIESASTPAELHPALPRATLEAWSMTSLEEHPGRPEVSPWLRGWVDDDEAQTTVVWRRHLPVTEDGRLFGKSDLEAFRNAADPHLAERLEAETWRVVEWLDKRIRTLAKLTVLPREDEDTDQSQRPLRASDALGIIFDQTGKARALAAADLATKEKRDTVDRALRGSILLVDERVGGLTDGPGGGLLSAESNVASDVSMIEGEERVVPFRVRRITTPEESSPKGWRVEARIVVDKLEDREMAWLSIESLLNEAAESEEGRSADATHSQMLEEHQTWTEQAARRIAEQLALPEPYAQMLQVSARLHDEGKRAQVWQRAFNAPRDGVYAKTTSRPNLQRLEHYRHELGSLPYAEQHPRVQALEAPLRELCLHLIAAHHGNARPVIRTDGAEEPPSRLQERAQEVALRFAKLELRWGPWGLAWWESLLRAADQQASRRNDLEGGVRG
jgi:CRISPR-associated endonuclease/helicase Cas3